MLPRIIIFESKNKTQSLRIDIVCSVPH